MSLIKDKLIFLSKEYQLVVGDNFQLFYQGVIRSLNYNRYNVVIECKKGNPFPRYFSYTPKKEDVGSYELKLTLTDDYNEVIEFAFTTLKVVEAKSPKEMKHILCVGDSITFNGVWPGEGYRRFTSTDGNPVGLGLNNINLIGTCKKEIDGKIIGYEGYGSWQWKSFVCDEVISTTSCIWVKTKHNKTENDQHSIWTTGGLKWILESIEGQKLKFKRGEGNYSITPKIDNLFTHIDGGINHEDIVIDSYEFEQGNPFFDKKQNCNDFKNYVLKNGFERIDYVYILLTWNGQYQPFNHDFSHHEKYMKEFIDRIHMDYPNAKVRLLGIQSPSITGGIASNYGASGPYSNLFGEISTAYFYDQFLEEFASRDEYHDFVKYVDSKAQFDTEYNMPYVMKPVNNRSQILEKIGTNGVHPTMDGYLQLGDVFYRILVHDMNEEA